MDMDAFKGRRPALSVVGASIREPVPEAVRAETPPATRRGNEAIAADEDDKPANGGVNMEVTVASDEVGR